MKRILMILAAVAVFCGIVSSCETLDNTSSSSSGMSTVSKPKVTKPSFDKYLSTTDLNGFSIRVRFKTGGDAEDNIDATVHWQNFAKKPSAKPSKGDLKKVESMRQYGVATYHNTGPRKGMTESIVFDKSHGGYNGGTYIYYYVECRNSVGKAETAVDYVVVKR